MLFRSECKKIFRSLTFWLYCIFIFLMFFTQYFVDCSSAEYKPEPGWEDYGYKISEEPEMIMDGALNSLMIEYASNRYICYPLGFYKAISLKDNDKETIENYLMELTGTDKDGINEIISQGTKCIVNEAMLEYDLIYFENLKADKNVKYDRFKEMMADIDNILGGGSSYEENSLLSNFSVVSKSYEEALEDYSIFLNEDKITGALARLFCDYSGIILSFLPVFVAAALTVSDKRNKMSELVFSKKISSVKLIFTRYSALVTAMFIPVLVTMIIALIQACILYGTESLSIHKLITLPSFWLLPEIMTASAAGMLITEIFSSGTAIVIQFVWAYIDLMKSDLVGDIGLFDIICRHNSSGDRDIFMANFQNFVSNRIIFIIISIIIVICEVWIYSLKRGGKFGGIRLFGKGGMLRRKA